MKKFLTPLMTISTLAVALPAFAATGDGSTSVDLTNICPGGSFGSLCGNTPTAFGSAIGSFITFGFILAAIVALVFMVIGGFKWITANGDSKTIGVARDQIINALVGLIFVFLSYILINVVLFFFANTSLGDLKLPQFSAQ